MNLEAEGEKVVKLIKQASWFPYRDGHLRDEATSGKLIDPNTYCITFDSNVAPYVEYLEEGTTAHDIPFAFVGKGNFVWWYPYKDGVPFLMGTGGRFEGKFHPGSTKHKGFISDKSVNAIIDYFKNKYGGTVRWLT